MGIYCFSKLSISYYKNAFVFLLQIKWICFGFKQSPRRAPAEKPAQDTEDYQRRETYSPDKRDMGTPQQRNVNSPYQQRPRSQGNPDYQREAPPQRNPGYETPKGRHVRYLSSIFSISVLTCCSKLLLEELLTKFLIFYYFVTFTCTDLFPYCLRRSCFF